jgi:hypothetical protein
MLGRTLRTYFGAFIIRSIFILLDDLRSNSVIWWLQVILAGYSTWVLTLPTWCMYVLYVGTAALKNFWSLRYGEDYLLNAAGSFGKLWRAS